MYHNINPATSYADPISRLFNAVVLNKKDYQDYRDLYSDAAWAKYLGFHLNKIKQSKYKPTQGDQNATYYTYPDLIINHFVDPVLGKSFTDDDNTQFLNNVRKLKFGLSAVGNYPPVLNDFTYSRGVDPTKGEYVSVYDRFDVNPFGGANSGDISLGIGKPFEFYDRLYLDDYYDIPQNERGVKPGIYYGGYLPEVTIKSKRKFNKKK